MPFFLSHLLTLSLSQINHFSKNIQVYVELEPFKKYLIGTVAAFTMSLLLLAIWRCKELSFWHSIHSTDEYRVCQTHEYNNVYGALDVHKMQFKNDQCTDEYQLRFNGDNKICYDVCCGKTPVKLVCNAHVDGWCFACKTVIDIAFVAENC